MVRGRCCEEFLLDWVAQYTQGRHTDRQNTGSVVWSVGGAVGLSRLVLGVHWPTDVLSGWLFAAAARAATRAWRQKSSSPAAPDTR